MLAVTNTMYAAAARIDPISAGLPPFWNKTLYTTSAFLRPDTSTPLDCIYSTDLQVTGCDYVTIGCNCYRWQLVQATTFASTCSVTTNDPVVHVKASPGPCPLLVRWGLVLRTDVKLSSPFCNHRGHTYDGPVALCEQVIDETITFADPLPTKKSTGSDTGIVIVVVLSVLIMLYLIQHLARNY